MKEIVLNDLLNIAETDFCNWTICLNNANAEGVYSFSQNEQRLMEHLSWKKHCGSNVSFRCIDTKYCLQFLRLDKDFKYDNWLFLGAYEVGETQKFDDGHETYNLIPLDKFSNYSERLIVEFKKQQGPKQAKIPTRYIQSISVVKILEKKYINSTRQFCGFNNVSLRFTELSEIIRSNVDNWRELLSSVNAIYCITDLTNGKLYIGSTYGFNGVWQRWACYVYSQGHGGDVQLKKLLSQDDVYNKILSNETYANNFKFSILEVFHNRDGNTDYILQREKYWKEVFATRQFGYNSN